MNDTTRRSGRLGLGIVGAGRVGPVLGAALAGAGHAIVGISAVSAESRERAHAMLPQAPILEVPTLVERSELVILAVPDRELPGLVSGLAATGTWQPGQLVLHTAPSYGVEVLRPAAEAGAIPSRCTRPWSSPAPASTSPGWRRAGSPSPRPPRCSRSRRPSWSRWVASRS
ncbi:NAD(P)-binding domain-containing protein [Streptomyces sp. L7]|uniref:NAD(P)-binding domain-containing protein n=1 Tax=Streptomyces sp. L7 TaxID=3423954 RepID=UPI003D97FE3E